MAVYGEFTSDGVSELLDIVAEGKYLKLTNTSAAGQFEWYLGYAADTATNVATGAAITSGGVTAFLSSESSFAAQKSMSAPFSASAGFGQTTITVLNHGYVAGDIIKITNTTSMRQIAGMFFQVAIVVDGNNFKINLDSSGFASQATAGVCQKLIVPQLWQPRQKFIVGITLGATTTIKTSVDHGYSVGQLVTLQVPSDFGSVQLNGLRGRISSVPAANEFVVDIDSSAATAFAFPASGAVPFSFAQVEPAGSQTTLAQGNVTPGASENAGVRGLLLGSSVIGSAGNVIYYYALT
jgi:hypothetical protein